MRGFRPARLCRARITDEFMPHSQSLYQSAVNRPLCDSKDLTNFFRAIADFSVIDHDLQITGKPSEEVQQVNAEDVIRRIHRTAIFIGTFDRVIRSFIVLIDGSGVWNHLRHDAGNCIMGKCTILILVVCHGRSPQSAFCRLLHIFVVEQGRVIFADNEISDLVMLLKQEQRFLILAFINHLQSLRFWFSRKGFILVLPFVLLCNTHSSFWCPPVMCFPLHYLLYKKRDFGTRILKVFSVCMIAQQKDG